MTHRIEQYNAKVLLKPLTSKRQFTSINTHLW